MSVIFHSGRFCLVDRNLTSQISRISFPLLGPGAHLECLPCLPMWYLTNTKLAKVCVCFYLFGNLRKRALFERHEPLEQGTGTVKRGGRLWMTGVHFFRNTKIVVM